MANELKDRIKKLRNRSADAIAKNDKTEQSNTGQKKKKKKKVVEKKGVGRDMANENADRIIGELRARMEAISDPAKRADLKSRIKALQDTKN